MTDSSPTHSPATGSPVPDSSGRDSSGPDSSGPDSSAPDSSGPDSRATAPGVTTPLPKIKSALFRYRVMAWVTGIWLLLLVAEMIAKYGFGVTGFEVIGIVHGWIYVIYLICTVDLAMKVRWPAVKTVLTCLAGTVPFLSFWVEHLRAQDVKTTFGI